MRATRFLHDLENMADRWDRSAFSGHGTFAIWFAAAFAIGVGAYFWLPQEPPVCSGAVMGCVGAAWAWSATRFPIRFPALWMAAGGIFLAIGLGFLNGQLHAWSVPDTPTHLPKASAVITGTVESLEPRRGRWRVVLTDVAARWPMTRHSLDRVRVTVGAVSWNVRPGDRVTVAARLTLPTRPVVPGGYDFQRRAWFEGVQAVGYAVGRLRLQPHGRAPRHPWTGLADPPRRKLAQALGTALPGDNGALARALTTGERGGISKATEEAFRNAGLAHLLAISGLHMGLVAGLAFGATRGLLALFPVVALRWNVKQPAAVTALLAMAAYLIISGAAVPAQRAFIMGALALIAMLLGRSALSLRGLAMAATAVLLLSPESLLGPSFQMSFSAAVALIATWGLWHPRLAPWRRKARTPAGLWLRWLAFFWVGAVFTSLVAEAATAPFAAFHFHALPVYGVVANAMAAPVVALLVAPSLMAMSLLVPLGLENIAAPAAALGLGLLRWVAQTVSSWPHAIAACPSISGGALVGIAVGGFWLCVSGSRRRWLGLIVIVVSLVASAVPGQRPALIVNDDMTLWSVAVDDGLVLSPGRANRFTRTVWGRLWGVSETRRWPDVARCDAWGCIVTTARGTIAFANHPSAVREDCARADIVVLRARLSPVWCNAPVVITRAALRREGAHVVFLNENGTAPRVVTVNSARGDRLWTR